MCYYYKAIIWLYYQPLGLTQYNNRIVLLFNLRVSVVKKRIVVYTGNHGSIDTLPVIAMACMGVFRKMGYEVLPVYLNRSPQEIQEQANQAFAVKPSFVLTFGYTYWHDIKLPDGRGICDALNIPLVIYGVDHPLLSQELSGYALPLQQTPNQNTRTLFVISADARWSDFLKQHTTSDNSLSQSVFLPLLALPSSNYPRLKPLQKRKEDILFVGSIIPPDAWRQIWHQKLPANLAKFIDDIVETHLSLSNNCDQLDNLIQNSLLANMPTLDIQLFTTIFSYAYSYIRFYHRYSLLTMLAKSHFPVCAHINQPISANLPTSTKFKIYPPTQFQKFVDLIANSQLVLTECSNFCHGGSERFFSTLLNSSVAVCNENPWLHDEFKSDKDAVFYSLGNLDELSNKLDNLFANPKEMSDLAISGQNKVMLTNTVEQFVQKMLVCIETFQNNI